MADNQKKKLPLGLKIAIGVIAFFVIAGFVVSIGLNMLGGLIATKGDKILEKGVEKWIETQASQHDAKVDVDFSKQGLVLKDKKSGAQFAVRADSDLPEGFPKTIPLPKNSKIVGSVTIGPMKSVTLETETSLASVANFYKEQMPSEGWKSIMQASPDDRTFTAVFRKGPENLSVGISHRQDKTHVSLNYSELKK